ncbi:DUF317 domain-containing protein [Streptomyces sp. SID3343]|uniref:DUF317 domain-containing protein n=1 Tax=Streptomyces sp. SID3343 TaxID=2690260 RepID=UPI00136BD911|nr:DUF317 domain-containing protein [Streptomyces sp. SID3343]MYW03350.1 DUF317 domain-containing protein [Streptomyces sp. SID3343]MYW06244.1 DUF317 domain-containing protein [Streptomyces sp. SID3343]
MLDNPSHHTRDALADAASTGPHPRTPPLAASTDDGRAWLTDPGAPHHVLATLRDAGWGVAEDRSANVYTSSPDACAFVRFTPEHPGGARGPLWEVAVDDHRGDDWTQTFDDSTPSELVHAFVTALLTTRRRTESV